MVGGNGQGYIQRRAVMGMADHEVMLRFHKAVGGVGRLNGPYTKRVQNKPMWYWTIAKLDDLIDFIDDAYELLSTRRREQADKILNSYTKAA